MKSDKKEDFIRSEGPKQADEEPKSAHEHE